jgi:DNA-binding helix-hairpin-helix protein with protein kinase domain
MSENLPHSMFVFKARSSDNYSKALYKLKILKSRFGGGEGTIYFIPGHEDFCVKVFVKSQKEKGEKINAFMDHLKGVCSGTYPEIQSGYSWRQFLFDYIAIPRSRVFEDQDGSKLIGYMMNYFDPKNVITLDELYYYNIRSEKRTFLYFILYEIFYVTYQLQTIGISIGDIDGSNILIRRHRGSDGKRIIFIDVDSAQLRTDSQFFFNDVWHNDTRPPEINEKNKIIEEKSLVFALSVITYKLLMGGLSPFQFLDYPEDDREVVKKGMSPLLDKSLKVPGGKNLNVIPDSLKKALSAGISPNRTLRPQLRDFLSILENLY